MSYNDIAIFVMGIAVGIILFVVGDFLDKYFNGE